MNENVDVSVIMPAYNTDKYIEEAIDSVCTQQFPKIELIIINDGSTDNTDVIINQKMKEYNNIIYIKQENSGLSYARKVGLDMAKGKYIYFVDSDDYITKNSLKQMYLECEKEHLDCLMVNAQFKNELNNDYGYKMDGKSVVSKISNTDITNGEELLKNMILNREWRYAVWLYFIKKSSLDKVTFFKNYIHEDSAFNYQLLNNTNRIKFMNEDLYVYRLRPNSLMSTKTSIKNVLGYINSYNIIYDTNNKKDNKYINLMFEMRILDQIIEVYSCLDEKDKPIAELEFKKIIPLIKNRNNYYVDKYRDFFIKNENINQDKTDVLDYIEYLEVDIVDHCNLNCKNCSHFSPLTEPNFLDINSFENDLEKLSSLTNGKLKCLVLMGGEPLLNKEINSFIEIANKYFPKTRLQIVTNGILINNMPENFWETCRKYNVQINITPYPINIDYIKIYDKILDKGLDLFIYDNGTLIDKKFNQYVFDESKSQDMNNNYINCSMGKNCANLKNGKIYLCPIVNNIDRYNKYYNTNYEVTSDDYIDLYKITSEDEIYNFLANPTPFCKYCDLSKTLKFEWEKFRK